MISFGKDLPGSGILSSQLHLTNLTGLPEESSPSMMITGFDFRIIYRPGPKAVRPDALSRKAEDRPRKANPDDRIKNRQRVILPPERFALDNATDRSLLASP